MSDPKVPPIGPRIREERARREVTIRALARVVGVSPSLISQIETGKSQPSVSTLYGITSALGLSLEDLFDASDEGEYITVLTPCLSVGPPPCPYPMTGPG